MLDLFTDFFVVLFDNLFMLYAISVNMYLDHEKRNGNLLLRIQCINECFARPPPGTPISRGDVAWLALSPDLHSCDFWF